VWPAGFLLVIYASHFPRIDDGYAGRKRNSCTPCPPPEEIARTFRMALLILSLEIAVRLQIRLRTKAIAAELGIAVKTAKEHRANLMRRMHAKTIVELISMCQATA
jgi:DNA-binding NarL/FixJ family response regulator